MKLAARSYYILMGSAFFAGNTMEACRVKWLMDGLEANPPPWLFDVDVKPPGTRQGFKTLYICVGVADLVLSINFAKFSSLSSSM